MSRAFCSVRSSKISDFRFLADFKISLEISSDSRRVYEISGRVYEISASDGLSYIIFLSFNLLRVLPPLVPIEEAVSVIRDKLQNDESLDERTCLSPACIKELLDVCLRSTYFRYNGNCYEQVDGAAMGSPVSAVVPNLYMEFFEEEALNSAPVKM